MLASQPPQLMAILGFPPEVLQAEIQKHGEIEKLKVRVLATILSNKPWL